MGTVPRSEPASGLLTYVNGCVDSPDASNGPSEPGHRMKGRPRHPKKEVEQAVAYAEEAGWEVSLAKGHAWARLLCPEGTRSGCVILSVWSTPRSPENHARQLIRAIDRCTHESTDDPDR